MEPAEETLPTLVLPNCARPLYRKADNWPYGRPREDLQAGMGAFIPNSVVRDPEDRFTPHLRVAKSMGFSLNGWGLVTMIHIPKSRNKGGETYIAPIRGKIFRVESFPLADLSHSYALPGNL